MSMNEKLKKIGKIIPSLMNSMEASHLRGIRTRIHIAVICTLCSIAINTLFVAFNYNVIPNEIPAFHDVNGVYVDAVHKSVFFLYELEFLLLLLIVASVAKMIKTLFKDSLIYARTRCLLFETANLYITSVVGITTILLAIAKGDRTVELSYLSQVMIFLFWTAVMIFEYVVDLRKIRKGI